MLTCPWACVLILGIFHCTKAKDLNSVDFEGLEVEQDCGRSRYHDTHRMVHQQSLRKRIVGGESSEEAEWPWLVSMMLKQEGKEDFEHMCGATLIRPHWILTAAHCFERYWAPFLSNDPEDWLMRIGEHNLFEEDTAHLDIAPIGIFPHPGHAPPDQYNHDIALVHLSRPVHRKNHIQYACVPDIDDVMTAGIVCTTAGWGHTQEGGNVSDTVKHVRVPIISNSLCNKFYSALQLPDMKISGDMMCAGLDDGGKDACQYDSGGPLMYFDAEDDRWVISGIVSLGYGCARSGFPGIYTRVVDHLEWIEETILREEFSGL